MKVGIVVAAEIGAIYTQFPKLYLGKCYFGKRSYYQYQVNPKLTIFVAHCKVGEISAVAATQFLIDAVSPDFVINFGFALDLDPKNANCDRLFLVEHVVRCDFGVGRLRSTACLGEYPENDSPLIYTSAKTLVLPDSQSLPLTTCLSGDNLYIRSPKINELKVVCPNASVADSESAGIAIVCRANKTPCYIFKYAAKHDCVDDGIYDEVYYYNSSRAIFAKILRILTSWPNGQN